MRVMVGYRGEEILLKEYNSYFDMDSDMLCFKSKEDMVKSLGLDPEIDTVNFMNNNDNVAPFNFDAIRAVHAYYSQKKGDEFTNWVYLSACSNRFNRDKLVAFFHDKTLSFTNGEDPSSINDVQNAEGKRLFDSVSEISRNLNIIQRDKYPLRFYRSTITKYMKEYLRKSNKYDYYYMRKFIMSLVCNYNYSFDKPIVQIPQPDMERREQVVEEFSTLFKENLDLIKQDRMKKFEEMTHGEEAIITPLYDIEGDKIDELPYADEEEYGDSMKKMIL